MQRILGQPRAVETLLAACSSGRVHHAWIFSGPKGTGKFTTALEFAKILLDPEAGPNLAGVLEADPGGRTARLIDAGTHPDLHVVRKELARYSDDPAVRRRALTNIPLDVLRAHMIGGTSGDRHHDAPAWLTPALGHGKVFIVDEAELLDENGQNALLKTLEEPPPRTYVILVTDRPERLLPTIHSRAQPVRFWRLDERAMAAWLDRAGLDLPGEERAWIERFSEGAPGLAALAALYGFHRWLAVIEPMLSAAERGDYAPELGETLAKLVDEFAAAWVRANANASKDAANKDGTRHLLRMLAARQRHALEKACRAGDDPSPILATIDLLRDAEIQLESHVNLKHLLENLVVQWIARAGRESLAAGARAAR